MTTQSFLTTWSTAGAQPTSFMAVENAEAISLDGFVSPTVQDSYSGDHRNHRQAKQTIAIVTLLGGWSANLK